MLSTTGAVWAEDANTYPWVEGPKKVDLGTVSQIDLDAPFVFLDGESTKRMLTDSKEHPSGLEIGSIFPKDPDQQWSVFFEYEETGHVEDDEKAKLDSDDILKSYKEGTEESNKDRAAADRVHVTGWDIQPFYEEKTHNLTWSMLAETEAKQPLLNYNVRLLTREGVISVILVSDPAHRDADRKVLTESILPKISMKQGQRYEDFDPTKDKVAEYGLTALVLGGAGLAVAKKVGLLAMILVFAKKFGVILLVVLGGAWKYLRGFFGRKKRIEQTGPEQSSAEHTNL
ncbi:DUF2167 domain-containing protein [Paenibacillus sp. S-38]|uniref:DUF2167 domain-containing protein n=1 Tax=Paenibacillus sp. S-38 TaxID=3416710 RepID=UPI003CFA1E1E